MRPPDQIISLDIVAEQLDVSRRKVQRLLQAGLLRGVRDPGGWRVTQLDVWRYQGVAPDMMRLWRGVAARIDASDDA